ncbi:LexA-binding, inner membrane-associated putative hydrolase [Candidatus Burarchaeum australiense]|nr:LexA-binding, inner membrane-associated putative hydrolase [Candidatus Burarchaeum australiense]
MDVLFHFLFTLMALYAARVHVRHHHLAPLIFAFVATLPDVDHFLGLVARGTLHNIFVTFFFPLILIALAFKYEKYGVFWKQMSILFFLVLVSHPILDFFTSYSVVYFYPVSMQHVDLTNFDIQLNVEGETYPIVSSASAGVLVYAFILAGAFFLEELVEIQDRTHRGFRYALGRLGEQVRSWLREP